MSKKHDKKTYKYFVYNTKTKKILSGWEYKPDAQYHLDELDFSNLKVYTRMYLSRIGVKPSLNKNWGTDRLSGSYSKNEDRMLYGFRKDIQIPEIRLRFNKGKTFERIDSSKKAYEFLKKVYGRDIGIQEQIIVMYMDNSNNVLGYYKHTVGTPVSAMADIPMILGIALKSLSRSFILSHNHPSGNRQPSNPDNQLTKQLYKAAKIMNINMLDHIIATKDNSYYSYGDSGNSSLGSLGKTASTVEDQLRLEIAKQLKKVNSKNAPRIYQKLKEKGGYAGIESRIIQMVVRDGITPSACIPQIEVEL